MIKSLYAATMLFIAAPAFALDCANASQSNDLISCSIKQLATAQARFADEAKKLSQTEAIDPKIRRSLAKFYTQGRRELSQSCKTTYAGSRLQAMYVNGCKARQIDLLNQSQHACTCGVQRDAGACS